jgi:hypothetical protein
MVFLGGLAPAEIGNLREVFAVSTAETSMIADWSTVGGYDPDTGTTGRPPGRASSCSSSARRLVAYQRMLTA